MNNKSEILKLTQNKLDLSIIIVNYNTRDMLLSCLRSLSHINHNLSLEVIVIDNGSTDNSIESVQLEFPNLLLIQNLSNMGYGSAVNIAIKYAHGRYIAILNPDTIIPPNTLQYLLSYLDSHPEPRVVSCRLVGHDGHTQTSCARFPTPLRVFSCFTRLDRILPIKKLQIYYDRFGWRHFSTKGWQHDEAHEVDTLLGAFFVMPLKLFVEIGGFDERYFMYYEEVDLFRKIRAAGYRAFFLPEVYIIHYGGQATRREYARMRFEQQRSLLQYLQKWHGTLASELIRWFLIILACFRFIWAIVSCGVRHFENSDRYRLKGAAYSILQGLLRLNPRRFYLP